MEVVEFGPLTAERRHELEGDETDPFDADGITLRFRAKDRHVGLRDASGRLAASAGLVVVEVEVGDERFPVVGLGGVIVRASDRGRGLGRAVVEAAMTLAATLGPGFAMLFCHDDRAGLYGKLGFVDVGGQVLVQQPTGYASIPQRTMRRALKDGATWPSGSTRVHSLPF
jgi:predicted N-acetyltransferase YhbS